MRELTYFGGGRGRGFHGVLPKILGISSSEGPQGEREQDMIGAGIVR